MDSFHGQYVESYIKISVKNKHPFYQKEKIIKLQSSNNKIKFRRGVNKVKSTSKILAFCSQIIRTSKN